MNICSYFLQSIEKLLRHFTLNHKCQPHGGARGKSRGSSKSFGLILWSLRDRLCKIHHKNPFSVCRGIKFCTKLTYRERYHSQSCAASINKNLKKAWLQYCENSVQHSLYLQLHFTVATYCIPTLPIVLSEQVQNDSSSTKSWMDSDVFPGKTVSHWLTGWHHTLKLN